MDLLSAYAASDSEEEKVPQEDQSISNTDEKIEESTQLQTSNETEIAAEQNLEKLEKKVHTSETRKENERPTPQQSQIPHLDDFLPPLPTGSCNLALQVRRTITN
jgi:hypothetical protein